MAKKTASKKKAKSIKAKTAKSAKPKSTKPVKSVKPPLKLAKSAAKIVKTVAKMLKPASVKPPQPELMSKKAKKVSVVGDSTAPPVDKKTQTIVSMMEAELPASSILKAEKIGKIKSIKVDRGNLADEKAKWVELSKKYGKDKALNYKMTETYPAAVPLQHKVLGWGYILSNENDRLEVLFENGIRMLISNYKS